MTSKAAATTEKRRLSTAAASPPAAKRKVRSGTTKSAVVNFFKPLSQKEPEKTKWKIVGESLLVARYFNKDTTPGITGLEQEEKKNKGRIAGFDLDSTLIKTQSGNKFAKGDTDWKWWDDSVVERLRGLHGQGYKILIFTNQGGLKDPKKESVLLSRFKIKVSAILNALDIPITLYAATSNDKYRKPRTGMWTEMLNDCDLDVDHIDLSASYLVGDAAGREGDHSDSDRHWAENLGIGFHTPEEYFLNEAPKPMSSRFDPTSYLGTTTTTTTALSINTAISNSNDIHVTSVPISFSKSSGIEIVMFVGSPGAGKSTFYRRHLEPLGFERINQDTLKTRDRCLKAASELLQDGKSVAIDNTNADVDTRAKWISLAGKFQIPIRCVYFTAPAELCQHNDAVRALGGDLVNPEKRTILPKMAFTGYSSRFKEPERSEGFHDLTKVDFQWEGGDNEREIWRKFWT